MNIKDHSKKKINALIIDTHIPMRQFFRHILNSMGIYDILESSSGRDAISKLESCPTINLVICDLDLHDLSGFEIVTYIRTRETYSDIPFLMVSGNNEKDIIVKAQSLGACDYALKPINKVDIKQKISRIMSSYMNPSTAELLYRRGDKLFHDEKYYEALAIYQQANKADPESAKGAHVIAKTFFKLGQTTEAIKILLQSCRTHPHYYRNYALLANIYLKRKNYLKAINYLQKELDINPRQPHRSYLLGKIFAKAGSLSLAIDSYLDALKDRPKFDKALYALGVSYYKLNDFEACFKTMKKLLRLYPNHENSLKILIALGSNKDWSNTIEKYFISQIARDPKAIHLYFCLTKHYFNQTNLQQSMETLNKILDLCPSHPRVQEHINSIKMQIVPNIASESNENSVYG